MATPPRSSDERYDTEAVERFIEDTDFLITAPPDLVFEDLPPIKLAWSSFGLVDAILLIVALGIGGCLMYHTEQGNPEITIQGIDKRLNRVVWCLFYTSPFCSILLLFGQFIRGRMEKLTVGEMLGLAPLSLIIAMLVIGGNPIIFILWLLAQIFVSLYAFCYLVFDLLVEGEPIPCRWADRIGSVTCAYFGPMTFYVIRIAFMSD